MGCLIETLRYGRAIARKEGSGGNISWSADKETLQLYDQQLTMTAFREMVWSTVRECREQLQELMFGWEPAINLSRIVDNMAERRPGWSFLQEPGNGLHHSFKHLHRRAWTSKSRGLMLNNQWSQSRCGRYLQLVEAFKQKLFSCIHLTDGQRTLSTLSGVR